MTDSSLTDLPQFLAKPTRFMFFTGKGGVGKTSIAGAAALSLADHGKSVLLVSTDPASNLDEILDVPLTNQPVAVPNAAGLSVLNIDPTAAADAYRMRVLDQMDPRASPGERDRVREQLSGSCTTEIAAFDEFVGRLTDGDEVYDHVLFDTAPTGHTLRLLSLPKAWSGFLAENDQCGLGTVRSISTFPASCCLARHIHVRSTHGAGVREPCSSSSRRRNFPMLATVADREETRNTGIYAVQEPAASVDVGTLTPGTVIEKRPGIM